MAAFSLSEISDLVISNFSRVCRRFQVSSYTRFDRSSYGFDEQALHDDLLSRGFATFVYEPAARELKSLAGQRSTGGNTVYARDPEKLTARLKSAPRYRLGTGVSI